MQGRGATAATGQCRGTGPGYHASQPGGAGGLAGVPPVQAGWSAGVRTLAESTQVGMKTVRNGRENLSTTFKFIF